jgi:pimeloyl-ACP methyl ester carboxylesterase
MDATVARRRFCLLLLLLLGGCSFRQLGRDLEWRDQFGVLRGRVSVEPESAAPLVVVYAGDAGDERVVDTFVLARPGSFYFVLPPGSYRLASFEDRDGDLRYRPGGDPVVLYETAIVVHKGQTSSGLDMVVRADSRDRLGLEIAVPADALHGSGELPEFHLGEVVTLDDERFSDDNASLGLWHPAEFLFDVGAGVYFLEPYDDQRTPVLFVHGALGHPGIWREMVAGLDRTRFQPWFVYYPTAAHLDAVATALDRWMQRLKIRHQYQRLVVVAHSMGGLVGRAFVNRAAPRGEIALLVTMSTPWQGHAGAGRGVEKAPVVAPSWYDMAPGSEFLQALLKDPLPPDLPFYLLFTFGDGSALMGGANDGAVMLASQLDERAQRQATRHQGFDVGHGAILRSPAAAAEVARLVSEVD